LAASVNPRLIASARSARRRHEDRPRKLCRGAPRRGTAFYCMRAPDPLQDLLYFVADPWPWGKPHEAARLHHAARPARPSKQAIL